MCGISGYINQHGATHAAVQAMNDALRHRGPDGVGEYVAGPVGLGQRRLSFIDLSGGGQPMPNEDGTIWITFNGEIYNYRELRAGIEGRHQFATNSDTEVILHLYEEKGAGCLNDLRGMFAFALWDGRDGSLLLARDHLGQKPMFYAERDGWLAFGSEIKALLALEPKLRELNCAALHQYLSLRIIAAPNTMFKQVHKLPPGHFLQYRNGQTRVERYWHLSYGPKLELSETELLDELDRQMQAAVRYCMIADVEIGAFLSGGLDSSLVVAMMAQASSTPIKTFSVGVPYAHYSELPFARAVAERYGTEHYEETIEPSLIRELPDVLWHMDEPSDALSVCVGWVARMARRHVKGVLGGDGGDELFGGYDRYYGNQYVDYYAQIPEGLRRVVFGPALDRLPEGFWYKSFSHKAKWMHQMSFAKGGRRYAKSLNYFYFSDDYRSELYGDTLRQGLGSFDPQAVIADYFDQAAASESLDRMLYADSMVRLPDHPVMIQDRMTMAHGLEARAPFMDHVLAEFCARIPTEYKVRGRTLRYIQRRLAERYLPPDVLTHKKQGFASALPYLLADEFKLLFKTFLLDSHLVRDGYLQAAPIERLLGEHLNRKRDHGNRLWLLCNAEMWYRMQIQGWSKAAIAEQIQPKPAAEVAFAYA